MVKGLNRSVVVEVWEVVVVLSVVVGIITVVVEEVFSKLARRKNK